MSKRAALLCCGAVVALASESSATNPVVVFPARPERLRAVRYAAHPKVDCLAELELRGIPFAKGPPVPSIDAPIRLTGPLRGVQFEHKFPTAADPKGPVMDCRLALGLDDAAVIARDQGFSRVRFNSIYRGRWARVPGQRHPAGVAIDVVELVKKDGTVFNVKKDYAGAGIGSKTCGPEAPVPPPGKAATLRRFICALDESRSFNLILTPHYDRRHADHFHLEVRRKIKWFLTQ
ncbi:MAG: hypothetical protein R3B13_32005 [Polyangiaceae bacterium]